MSQVIVTPSPLTSMRQLAVRIWEDPDSRSTAIGLVGVLIVHLLVLLFAPHMLRLDHAPSVLRPHSSSRQFNIELAPETYSRPVPKPPMPKQFVETNPDAPENTPDKTNNFAAQNQQVAQEKPTPNGHSERPAMEGKKDFQSTQIVSGRLEKPVEQLSPPPMPQVAPTPPHPSSAPRAEQNPLPGFDRKLGDNPNAFGSNVAEATANARPIPNKVEGQKDVPLVEGALGLEPAIDPKHPRPRPMIVRQQQVRPAIFAENKIGTENVGVIAINAKFNNYGAYLQRLVEAIQLEWDKIVDSSETYPPVGSYVVVHFFINSEGKIARFGNVENHSSDVGMQYCTSAITNRQPYGEWTDDMKASLNPDGEELIFTFYYQ
ncbi:MAG TPA: hypothetical protein VHE61_11945 [Opitutaceae bacterium]|nr:hypothetical protein [Opitutaceae bacterium]